MLIINFYHWEFFLSKQLDDTFLRIVVVKKKLDDIFDIKRSCHHFFMQFHVRSNL